VDPVLAYAPLLAGVALVAGLGFSRRRPPADEPLVQLRGRPVVSVGGAFALAGLGFAIVLAVALFAPTAAICLASETCPEGPALWVSSAGLLLLALAAAIAWPALTRSP
jgi:hypothetical protein